MTPSLLTMDAPVKGVEYDKNKPETRAPWLEQRRGGVTATEIRDWGNGSKRRKIITAKVTGEFEDLSHIPAVDHGNRREPVIAAWIHGKFGIEDCNNVFSHANNPRHLASPDGITRDPFTGELVIGTADAVLSEIKTSKHDLNPGKLDAARVLVQIDHRSHFHRSDYYIQMNWQMYVMNATRTLFVWEQHDGTIDPETGTFRPIGPPEWAWIPRDEALIQKLVTEVAPAALAEIDAARLALSAGTLPPVSAFPAEDAIVVADLIKARDAESTATSAKESAWGKLTTKYVVDEVEDFSIDIGIAQVTLSTSTPQDKVTVTERFNEEAWAKRAPKQYADYLKAREKYTEPVKVTTPGKKTRRLTVTAKKVSE